MGLLGYEMKKIWNPAVCAVILILGILYYYLFCSFYMRHLNNGPYEQAQFDLSAGWSAKYGTTMEPDVFLDKAKERCEEIRVSSARYGYLPSGMMSSTLEYVRRLTVWSILSVVLLISPALVRDRLHRMRGTQWTSRKGRRLLRLQIIAASLSSVILTLLNITAYAAPFLMQNTLIFKDFSLFSIYSFTFPWTDWTYGTYLLILCGMVFLISVSVGGFATFLSQFSAHYVAMLLKALPLYVCFRYLCAEILMEAPFFRYYRPVIGLASPPCYEWGALVALLALSVLLRAVAYRRNLRLDI